jgi:hypothetical protein
MVWYGMVVVPYIWCVTWSETCIRQNKKHEKRKTMSISQKLWKVQAIVSLLFLISLIGTRSDVLAFSLSHPNLCIPTTRMMRRILLSKRGFSSSTTTRQPIHRFSRGAALAKYCPRTFTSVGMSTSGNADDNKLGPPSLFRPGQPIQVEVLSFGPLGASVVRCCTQNPLFSMAESCTKIQLKSSPYPSNFFLGFHRMSSEGDTTQRMYYQKGKKLSVVA